MSNFVDFVVLSNFVKIAKGKGPRVYPCIFGTCTCKTVVAPQKTIFDKTAKQTRESTFKIEILTQFD